MRRSLRHGQPLRLRLLAGLAPGVEPVPIPSHHRFIGGARLPEGLRLAPERISVNSNYFLVSLSVELHGAQARGSALLVRDSAGWPGVAWKKFP